MNKLIIVKRDGTKVDYKGRKITKAIESAMYESPEGVDNHLAKVIEKEICNIIQNEEKLYTVENISDLVEKLMMKYNRYEAAKRYILYREEHRKKREEADRKST